MKVTIKSIRWALEKILVRKGLSLTDARLVADEYLEGELQEKYSHGLAAFPSIVPKINPHQTKTEIVKKTHSLLFVDAHNNLGAIVGNNLVDSLIKMAKKEVFAAGLIKNMTAWLRPGTIAKKIADQGYVGLVINSGGHPIVAPPGGFDPVISTNPIGIGIPTADQPIVVDMATAKHAWGLVRISEKLREKLPTETFYDKNGHFTQTPSEAYSAAPAGDYKGFALGLLIEILCGALVGMPMGGENLLTDYRVLSRGAMILVIDPQLIDLDRFKKSVTNLLDTIKKSSRLNKDQEIIIPGERSLQKRQQKIKTGFITVEDSVWESIQKLA